MTSPNDDTGLSEEQIEDRRLEILEQEPMVRLFSNPANVKILTVLIDAAHDMSASGIARQAGISRNTWYANQDLLLELDLIQKSREEAGAKFWELKDNDQTEVLVQLYDALRL